MDENLYKEIEKRVNVAINLAMSSGKNHMKYFGNVERNRKSDNSIVTKADLEAEENIRNGINTFFQNDSILGEEKGMDEVKGSDFLWIVDPLDGTTNLTMSFPYFNVSIGIAYNRKIIGGVVYYPILDELFVAVKGSGSFLLKKPGEEVSFEYVTREAERLSCSNQDELKTSLLTFCHGKDEEALNEAIRLFKYFKKEKISYRQFGAAALELCYVAAGRTDAYIMPGIKLWDIAAGKIIVEEAGGSVTDDRGDEFTLDSNYLVASNNELHEKLIEITNNN